MRNKVIRFGYLILLSFTLVLLCFGFTKIYIAYAAETDTSSTIMYELTSDPSFKKDDYPANATDYKLYVIQIGESKEKDLFLYVHQPSHNSIDLLGTSVSISYGFSSNGAGLHPKMYGLELVSTSGMFDKYLVKGIKDNTTSGTDGQRYYNIVAIYRKFNEIIDTSIEHGETNEIGIEVSQQWYAYDINNSVAYQMATFETMEIKINLIGHLDFENGFKWGNLLGLFNKGKAFFAAFNVKDYVIQHIYDADISFKVREVLQIDSSALPTQTTPGEWQDKAITLFDSDIMTYSGGGLFARTYEWNRIMPAENFINTAESQKFSFVDVTKDKIKESQWVFSFYETQSTSQITGAIQRYEYSEISEFAILRLHFMDTSGKIFDLGVVSDKVTPDNIPDGYGGIKDLADIMKDIGDVLGNIIMIIGIILLVIIIIAASGFITPVFKVIGFIFKAIITVITLPLKLIKGLFKNEKR